jgi:hypothetical protein
VRIERHVRHSVAVDGDRDADPVAALKASDLGRAGTAKLATVTLGRCQMMLECRNVHESEDKRHSQVLAGNTPGAMRQENVSIDNH